MKNLMLLAPRAQHRDLIQRFRGGLAHDRVQDEVGDGLLADQPGLTLKAAQGQLAILQERHVAEGGDAPGQGRRRPGCQVVHPRRLALGGSPCGGEVHMGVDAARQDEVVRGVDLPCPRHRAAQLRDPTVMDPDVGDSRRRTANHQAAADD